MQLAKVALASSTKRSTDALEDRREGSSKDVGAPPKRTRTKAAPSSDEDEPSAPSTTPVRTRRTSNKAHASTIYVPKPKPPSKTSKAKPAKLAKAPQVREKQEPTKAPRAAQRPNLFASKPASLKSLLSAAPSCSATNPSSQLTSASDVPSTSSQPQRVPTLSVTSTATNGAKASQEDAWSRAEVCVPGKVVWVSIDGAFWWPGRVCKAPKGRDTIDVELFRDSSDEILEFSSDPATVGPSPSTLLTFKPPCSSFVRFPLLSSASLTSDPVSLPSSASFNAALSKARSAFVQAAIDDDDELPDADEAMLLDGATSTFSQGGPSQRSTLADIGDASLEEPVPAEASEDEDEEEYDPGPDEELNIPGEIVLAADKDPDRKSVWWPGRVMAYVGLQIPPGHRGKGKKRKEPCYTVQFCDGEVLDVPRGWFATEYEDAFFDKPMGDVRSTDTVSAETLAVDIEPHLPFLERTILGDPSSSAEAKHRDFIAGGNRRRRLGDAALYGSFSEAAIAAVAEVVKRHFLPRKKDRPRGDEDYEGLTDAEKTEYCTDVLVPEAIFLRTVAEHLDDAREQLLLDRHEGGEETPDAESGHEVGQGKTADQAGGELDENEVREKAEDLARKCLKQEDFYYQVLEARKARRA